MVLICTSADLQNHYSGISKICRENRKPAYITVDGRGDTVLLDMSVYEQMKAELELLRMLADAEDDVRVSRVAPIEETFGDIRKSLLAR